MITDESLKQQSKKQPHKTPCPLATDNLAEILIKVIEFTHTRQKTLVSNIRHADEPGFVPMDLPCTEFAAVLNIALDEYARANRLLFVDTPCVKFASAGRFRAEPRPDNDAKQFLETSKEKYIQNQVEKIIENALNQRFAAQLLRERSPNLPDCCDGHKKLPAT